MEEERESLVQVDRTVPDPQHYLRTWLGLMSLQQNTDDLNDLVLELGHSVDCPALVGLFLVLYSEGATSSMTGNSLESL